MSELLSNTGPTSPPGASQDACPTPLAWQDVLAGVHREAQPLQYVNDHLELDALTLGEGPLLWFFNGFTGDRLQFGLLAWLLKERFRCVLCDYRWLQRSSPREHPALLGDAVVEAANGAPLHLFATSFGSLPALAILRRSPDRCRSAIFHAGFVRRQYSLSERLMARLGLWSTRPVGQLQAWRQIQETNHRTWFPPIDPGRWEFLRDNLSQTPINELSLRVQAAAVADDSGLEQIRTPVQLIRTEGDGRVLTAAQNVLAERLPNVRDETLHTSGHYAFLTHPHRVAKIIKAFVDSLPV